MRVLDTSVIVDHLRGQSIATSLLDDLTSAGITLVISEVVRFELLAGVRSGDEQTLEAMFATLDVRHVTEDIARQAGVFARRYRGSHSGIDAVDYLVAATALVLDAPLVTRNVRHFPMFSDLEPPY